MFAAFEAHVVNVTARIENALSVSTYSFDFGTVFPQEKFDRQFGISLSSSFQDTERADDVEYTLRQKPKCVDNQNPAQHPQVKDDGQGNFFCPEGSTMMPLLCPYLSKAEVTTDPGAADGENDMSGPDGFVGPLASFHGPTSVGSGPDGWNLGTTFMYQLNGRLAKSEDDRQDIWNIDLKVPCFGGSCAQDWAEFVAANDGDNNATAADYIQPAANESKVFGCDLWLEVRGMSSTGIEEPPATTGTLTVTKQMGEPAGPKTPADFQLYANDIELSNGSPVSLVAGSYLLSESSHPNYTAAFSGDADCADGLVDLAVGESISCIITNTYNPEPVILLSDGFGTGSSVNDIPNWEETGDDGDSLVRAQAPSASGNDSASPDGGRFAKIGDGQWICRDINASGYEDLILNYYWRGDPNAEDNESGIVEFQLGAACAAGVFTNVANYELDDGNNNADEGWSSLQSIVLPSAVDDTTFALRFRNAANADGEHWRVDGISLTGFPN